MAILRHNGIRSRGRQAALLLLSICLQAAAGVVQAEGLRTQPGEYLAPAEFIADVFPGSVPTPGLVWLRDDKRNVAEQILGHAPGFMRIRYWGDRHRSAWVLEEIGKTEPITFGVVIAQNQVEDVRVLAFRETRGWEIKYPAFTRQFLGVELDRDYRLDQPVDGISGATLSVDASRKVVALALYLAGTLEP